MDRRYFLKDFFFWILAFFFGYTIKKNEGSIALQQIDSATLKDKDKKSVIDKLNVLSKGKLFAADFGVKGDGVDDTRAIDKLIDAALSYKIRNTTLNSNDMGDIEIIFPSGTFVYRGKDLFSTATNRTSGFKFSGAGKYATRILYRPFTTGNYMFHNNDKLLGLTFEDMSFYGDVNNNFMLSHSSGGAQNYIFNRVTWNNWNKVIELIGDNTNSEMTWYSCNFNGTIKKVLYSGTTNTSDQFLNYNFFACNYEVQEGDFIDMARGGNINIWGGSFIHINPNAGTFFKLNGNNHARGVQRFICIGGRFEHRNPASKLIECGWGWGTVDFISCDTIANEDGTMDKSTRAIFNAGNEAMPNINFQSCQLAGVHEYVYSTNSGDYPHVVEYRNCFLYNMSDTDNLDKFIKYTGTTNPGGKAYIRFRNCRTKGSSFIVDCDYSGLTVSRAILHKRVASAKSWNGAIVFTSDNNHQVRLPLGAIITNVQLYIKAGAMSSTSIANYKVQTSESTPTTIFSFNDGKTTLNAGINVKQDVFFVCDTAEKALLKFVAGSTVNQTTRNAYFLVEFLG